MMMPDLDLLAEKVDKLVALTQTLRSENANLRQELVAMRLQNQELQAHKQEAATRVAALIAQLPTLDNDAA